jgi:hypothetical protein
MRKNAQRTTSTRSADGKRLAEDAALIDVVVETFVNQERTMTDPGVQIVREWLRRFERDLKEAFRKLPLREGKAN